MEELSNWTLGAIRADSPMMSWMEERRFDWVAAVSAVLTRLMQGGAIVVVADRDREWFASYVISMLNRPDKKRPLLPVFNASELSPHLDRAHDDDLSSVQNMLSIAFGSHFAYWYIGRGSDNRAIAPRRSEGSFLWALDEEIQNSFFLRSADNALDIKLMHLARLFDKTIDAVMFGEVNL
ncbi:hypothetical protein FACS189487_02510 [Campylobacterota bacterium]|nr:hypothetical protein FACS189487_02510 [Campylobacterota bacterium]